MIPAEVATDPLVPSPRFSSFPFEAPTSPVPSGADFPSKVTRAFSAAQVKFALLKRARIVFPESGMEKLVCASEMSRAIESPSVTSLRSELGRVVVVHPVALALVHVVPVNPFVHIQAQDPESSTDVPPF